MVAPDITGDDIDGKKLRLCDCRGKVVLLTFWGHWCGPCRVMYEKQRTQASDLAKKPFAMVGINSDRDRDALKKVVADEKLPGRSFWNGGSTAGPISTAWQIRGWPAIVLIDAKGVIRKKWVGSPRADVLDKAIDDLSKEAEGH
jgi:peroxiredoxin